MNKGVKRAVFFGIVVLALGLRLRGIMNPLLDDQAWRQADTASMGLNMLGHLTHIPNVFFPKLFYDGSVPQKVELEFPFLPYLLAWTWTLFGWADIWGRLWAILFSLLALWGLYDLGRSLLGERMALMAAGFYAVTPLAVYYGRVVMPEPVAQAFSVWALALAVRWQRNGQRGFPLGPALGLAGAALAKLPQLMLLPVALTLAFWPRKRAKAGFLRALFFYLVVSMVPVMLYYGWVHLGTRGQGQFVSGILTQQVASGKNFFPEALRVNIYNGFTRVLLTAALLGVCLLPWQPAAARRPLLIWGGINVLYVAVVCLRIPLDYYLVPLAPWFCLLAAAGLGKIEDTPGNVLAVVVLSLACFNGFRLLTPRYAWNPDYLVQAGWLRKHLQPGQYLLLSDSPPMTLYYTRTPGFRLSTGSLPAAVREVEDSSAAYLVLSPYTRQPPAFRAEIRRLYPEVGPGIFRLGRSTRSRLEAGKSG
ncbi:hypothetical protein CEB3_c03970 [Peptococcaceae bacterium CEB3]|nr:hypothetical protein CEB3_c03970 [Peptococcaceae bacterium CEB3]